MCKTMNNSKNHSRERNDDIKSDKSELSIDIKIMT